MLRNVLLFCAAVLLALTAGRAFWVSLGENPFNMSGATYVEFFQQARPPDCDSHRGDRHRRDPPGGTFGAGPQG